MSLPLSFTVVTVLLLINAYFVALEFALVAVRSTKVDELVSKGVRGAKSVKVGKKRVDDFVAMAQLGITVASLALGMVAESSVVRAFNALFEWLDMGHIQLDHSSGWGAVLALSLVTILHVVLGEQVPKMLAIARPERVSLITSPPAEWILKLSSPFIVALSWMTGIFLKMFGVHSGDGGHHGGHVYSEDEIKALLLMRQQAGLADKAENEMIDRVFSLFDMVASQLMIPRNKMECLEEKTTLREAVNFVADRGHDRYPVYRDKIDDVVGILLVKDLVAYISEEVQDWDQGIGHLVREVLCIPGSLTVPDLLTQMKEQHTRLAVLLDEYGGTSGMVTLGDVLEKLVGEVDEVVESEDEEVDDFEEIGEGVWLVSGLVLLEEFQDKFEVEIEDEFNDTIGGAVFSRLGRKPSVGDEVHLDELVFEVEKLDGIRIDRLKVWHDM